MDGKNNKIEFILIILLGISALFVFYSVFSVRDALCAVDSQAKAPARTLELAAQAPSEDNQKLIEEKQALEKRVAEIDAKLVEAEKTIGGLKNTILLLEGENSRLKENNNFLTIQVNQLTREKEDLEARISSLKELKKAIRRVKLDIHKKKVERFQAKVKKQKEIDQQKLVEGNRGFLVKDGKNISGTRVNIEVVPE